MRKSGDEPVVFVVPGQARIVEDAATRGAASRALPIELEGARFKHSVRAGTERGGGEVRVTAVPDVDVVVLHIAGGPSLYLHPNSAEELLRAQVSPDKNRGATTEEESLTGEVKVPIRLQWSGLNGAADTRGGSRGFLGDVLLAGVDVITNLFKKGAVDVVASKVVEAFDDRVTEGVYLLQPDRLVRLKDNGRPVKPDEIPPTDNPLLVFVHGTFSDTAGTFGKLWSEHPQLVRSLFDKFGGRVYGLDHRTLGSSPIANALTLVDALPKNARVHLVTHSRGGLVAEVLARACAPRDDDLSEFVLADDAEKAERDAYASQRKALEDLFKLAKKKNLQVERVVRVACPARGTLLASKRLDAYISVVKWSLELARVPVVPELVDLLGAVAKHRTDPAEMPGLAAQIPDSPLVRWLHASGEPIPGELRVVAGDIEGDSVTSWLKMLASDSFFWTDNDLIVQTRSMYGGAPRADGARFVLDKNGKVSHFSYFGNEGTANAIVSALTQDVPQGFRAIGPLSWAGTDSSGDRAAARASRASTVPGERPAVFVLPGIVGSNLKAGSERIWLSWHLIGGLKRLEYTLDTPDDVKPDGPVGKIYDDLCDYLSQNHDVIEFAFDWRLPIEEEARRLAGAVEAALDARVKSGQPVRLLAHSMGGLVARTMQLEKPDVWRRMMAVTGARFLMLGTPNGGSWAPMQVLSGDDTFGNMIVLAGAPFKDKGARDIFARFPGLMQMQAGLLDTKLGLRFATTWKKLGEDDLELAKKHLGWHDVPLQQRANAWGEPPQAILDRAVALRKRLDEQVTKDLGEFSKQTLLVVGKAGSTPDGYDFGSTGLLYREAADGGDGRVPLHSALLPGVATWTLDCGHSALPSEKDAFSAYDELLRTGTTTRLGVLTHIGVRGAAASAEGFPRSRPAHGDAGVPPPESTDQVFGVADEGSAGGVQAAPVRALRVTVHNGDLTFERRPVVLGHYRATVLTGTEYVMNELIGGFMKDALALGAYPDLPGSHRIFMNTQVDPEDLNQAPRPEAVIVVGLGPEGSLRAGDIVNTVCHAVIGWAQRVAERPDGAPPVFELAATLLGTGGIGIAPGEAARLIAQGVYQANLRFAGEGRTKQIWPRVSHLHLIELYADRASEAWRALRLLADASPSRYEVADAVHQGAGALHRPLQSGYRGAPYDFLTAITEEGKDGQPLVVYSAATDRARTPVRAQATQGRLLRSLIERASNDALSGPELRRALFRLLVPLELEPFLAGSGAMQLDLDAGTAAIPWELLDAPASDGQEGPWAIRAKLLRKLRTETPRERVVDADPSMRVLVIGEPKCDPKLYARLPGARAEARAVFDLLKKKAQLPAEQLVRLISSDGNDEFGPDATKVVTTLLGNDWRIVHIAGHGEAPEATETDDCGDPILRKDGDPRGVVLSDCAFLGPREIGSMRIVPELVFLNCCYSGALPSGRALQDDASWRGRPYDRAKFAAGVAEKLIEIGVRCVVVTGWAVSDDAAKAFAETFYTQLIGGAPFIEAVYQARKAAYEMDGNTWAAYQCYGDPNWVFRREGGDAQSPSKPLGELYASVSTAAELVAALDGIAVASQFQHAEPIGQRNKLRYLEAKFGARWGAIGNVAEAFGGAWAEVVDRARAIEWYEQALVAEDGTASIKATEQLANTMVRHAWDRVKGLRPAAEATAERLAGKKSKGVTAGKAKRVAALPVTESRQLMADARSEIEKAITLIKRLLALHASMERESLCGSAYKRLAMLEGLAGQPKKEQEAVTEMREHYERAEEIGRKQGIAGTFYPALNRMAAALALSPGTGAIDEMKPAAVAALRDEMKTKAREDPDFWCLSGQTELELYEALFTGKLAEYRPALESEFRKLFDRVSSQRKWDSVADNAEFILPAYQKRAKGAEAAEAKKLLRFLEDLAAEAASKAGRKS